MNKTILIGNLFQFTPLREGRRHRRALHPQALTISIHAPPRGATGSAPSCPSRCLYFNSRPSARGDSLPQHVPGVPAISIHAPPRGATRHTHLHFRIGYISIHAPPRGATILAAPRYMHLDFISIHAPPRGATNVPVGLRLTARISIHAPPRGATAKDMQFLQIFCSTLTNQHGLTIVPRNLSRLFW